MDVAVTNRLLSSRQTLLGGTGDALENRIVDDLSNGAVAWVMAERAFYYLDKSSLAAPAPPVSIATSRGASSPGRWIRVDPVVASEAYLHARWSADQDVAAAQFNLIPNEVVRSRGDIVLDTVTGFFTLPALTATEIAAGVFYELFAEAFVRVFATPPGTDIYGWVDAANALLPNGAQGISVAVTSTEASASSCNAFATIAPAVNTVVHLRTQASGGSASISSAFSYVTARKMS